MLLSVLRSSSEGSGARFGVDVNCERVWKWLSVWDSRLRSCWRRDAQPDMALVLSLDGVVFGGRVL